MSTFHLMSLHRSGSQMLCTMLNEHPDIACIHETTNFIQNRLHLYRDQIEDIREKTGKPIVVFHHHECFTTDEMLNDEYPNILLHRADELEAAIDQYNISGGRPEGLYQHNKERIVEIMQYRITAKERMLAKADLVLEYDNLVKLTNDGETEFLPQIGQTLFRFLGVTNQRVLARTRAENITKPKNILELRAYGESIRQLDSQKRV